MTRAYADTLRASAEDLGAWKDLPFFKEGDFDDVLARLAAEEGLVLPAPEAVFAALRRSLPGDVRVVILGQDPYPTPGHANGLAFSVEADVRPLPRSLNNIYKELESDVAVTMPNGDLSVWADRGVLLLNTCLTVRAGEAASHAKIGWASLIAQVIACLANRDNIVWILWGKHAQKHRPAIEAGKGRNTLILESAHPSPLSARRGFFGSRPFSQAERHVGESLFKG